MTEGTGPEPASAASLCEVLEAAAADLEGVVVDRSGGRREYSRSGRPFAACEGGSGADQAASFRLRAEIVAAATNTPGAAASPRGPEWVTLRASVLDTFAVDRARAWFETAWRIAGEQPEPRRRPAH